MDHDDAKLLLRRAATFEERVKAIQAAQDLGMPLPG